MRDFARMVRLVGPAVVLVVAAPAVAQFATPDAVIRALYDAYGVGSNQKRGFASNDPATLKRFFDARLLQDWTRAHRKADDEPVLDYDYFIQGQDWSLTPVTLTRQAATGDTATVRAAFKNFGKPVVIDYDLTHGPEGWRIGDARAKGDVSLRRRLATPGR